MPLAHPEPLESAASAGLSMLSLPAWMSASSMQTAAAAAACAEQQSAPPLDADPFLLTDDHITALLSTVDDAFPPDEDLLGADATNEKADPPPPSSLPSAAHDSTVSTGAAASLATLPGPAPPAVHHPQPAASWLSLAIEVPAYVEHQVTAHLRTVAMVYRQIDSAAMPADFGRTHAAGVLLQARRVLCDSATTAFPMADYDPNDVRIAACLRVCSLGVTLPFLAAEVMTGVASVDMAMHTSMSCVDGQTVTAGEIRRAAVAMLTRVAAAFDFLVDVICSGGPHQVGRLQATFEMHRRGSELIRRSLASLRGGGAVRPAGVDYRLPEAPLRPILETLLDFDEGA